MKTLFEYYCRLITALSKAAFSLSMLIMLVLTLFVLIGTAARYLFNAPIPFTVAFSGYMMLALVFLAFSGTLVDGHHIKIRVIVNRLPQKLQNILLFVTLTVSLWWFLCLAIGCWAIWWYFFSNRVMPGSGIMIPLWIVALPLVIGSQLLLLQLLAEIGNQMNHIRKANKADG